MILEIVIFFALVAMFIYSALLIKYLKKVLGFRSNINKILAFLIPAIIGISYIFITCFYEVPTPIIYIVGFFVAVIIVYIICNGTIVQHMFVSLLFIFHLFITEGILLSSLSLVLKQNMYTIVHTKEIYSIVIFLSIMICLTIFYIFQFLCPMEKLRLLINNEKQMNLLSLIQSVLNILLGLGSFVYYYNLDLVWFSIYHCSVYIIISAIFYIIFGYCMKNSVLQEYQLAYKIYEEQLYKQVATYETQTKYVKSMRQFKHDYVNIKRALTHMIQTGDVSRLKTFLNDIDITLDEITKNYKEFSNNPLIQAILAHANIICEKNNISFFATVLVPDNIEMTELDLCRLISNIIDNAIEAAILCDKERKIDIQSSINEHWYTILCENSFDGQINMNEGNIITRKTDVLSHGFGIQNIREIIEKKKGFLNINADQESGVFTISLHIPYGGKYET